MATGRVSRRALVTGITGQDGSFLAELLLERGYEVIGMVRRPLEQPLGVSEHLRDRIGLVCGDLLDRDSLRKVVLDAHPDELYHLAAPSFVPESWEKPAETLAAIAGSTAALLEAVRDAGGTTRVFVAGSGAIFGAASESPQHEETMCRPETPYASAKLAAHQIIGQLRAHDGVFACSGILYNHESERRPESFVTRKITRGVAAIKRGQAEHVVLGDVSAVRDWSFAGDVMLGAWLMLQQDEPDDYVLASGIGHTVLEFAERAFDCAGLRAEDHITFDPSLRRPPEVTPRVGDASRAAQRLGWQPTLSFDQLIQRMVKADLGALPG
ncbi:MAG TPA: GDP-mannose 4,6-dehydratase [Solirubrobacteraceae bacterium]|nr:GDP-mannose 4,6-dehydratase [Solirubrobacteraceae bacterium]